jgi:serine/threonine-protein kinase
MNEITKKLSCYLKSNKQIFNIFGTFNINSQLGAGGTSIVRMALFNDTEYAIKFLLENIKTKESTAFKRFKQAHINISSIQHTGVILPQIHFDKLEIDDETIIPYIIMPKADMTLKEWRKDKELSFKAFEKLFKNIILLVDRIHQENIIHRDLKPENIFFIKDKLVLGDFDIAKFYDPAHIKLVETKKSERLANFAYSAPEQYQQDGNYNDITEEADWFAVGQILYWLISNETLRGQNDISLKKFDSEYIKYEQIIRKMLDQNPKKRFRTKQEIEDYLVKQNKIDYGLEWDKGLIEFEDTIIDKYSLGKKGFHLFNIETDINSIMRDLSVYNNYVLDKGNIYHTDVRLWWTQGSANNAIENKIEIISKEDIVWKIDYMEMKIKSISIIKHYSSFGGSFLVIETDSMAPSGLYQYTDDDWDEEYAIYNNTMIKRNEYDSGWAMINGERIKVSGQTELRRRIFKPRLFLVSPFKTSINSMQSDSIISEVLKKYKDDFILNEKRLLPIMAIKRRAEVVFND